VAGESAREFARRQREKAERHARVADLYERGAEGESATAAVLDGLRSSGWHVLHDVRWPGRTRANIDHVAVGPGGVFVIDSKNWSGDVRVVGGVLRQGSRRRDRVVAAAAEAAMAVAQPLQGLPTTPVLCFVRPEPIEGQAGNVLVCSTQNLATKLAAQPPVLGPESIRRVTTILQAQLSSATQPSSPAQAPAGRASSAKQVHSPLVPRRAPAARKGVRRVLIAGGGLLIVLVGLGLVGGLISVLQDVGESVKARAGAQESSALKLGESVSLPASSSHPPLEVKADKVMRVGVDPDFPVQRDQHLVAVRYSIRNEGTALWGAPSPILNFSALASNGRHAVGATHSDLPPNKVMPAAFNLKPGKVQRGFVVFAVPNGAGLVRVSVKTGFSSRDNVEWLIP
jgi:hypothetical protein